MEGTGRLEAFSDGVFAIAATLLVLEFSVSSGRNLGHQLVHLWPAYFAYVTSFVTIGIIWINHHHTVSLMGRTDRTMLVGDYLHHGGEEAAVLAYAGTLVIMATLHQFWWQYARRNRRLIGGDVPESALRAVDRAYAPGVVLYGVVFVLAFFSPLAAVALTFAIAAFYLPSAALFDR